VLGVLAAALVSVLLPEQVLAPYIGGGILAMVIMVSVGLPIYVCSTASIPVAVGFLHLGASPGAALAFLIAGPAANAATFTTVWSILGRRTAFVFLGTVFLGAISAGLLLDGVFGALDYSAFTALSHDHERMTSWFSLVSGVGLILVVLGALMPASWLRRFNWISERVEEPVMADSLILEVSGMTCSHCTGTVERGLRGVPGVTGANVDLESGRAVVRGSALDHDALVRVVRELGYEAKPAGEGL
jgi:copper chaperone CopZ